MPLMMNRFGRPGLLGLAARTAVVAGTASAVNGAVRNRQQRRYEAAYEQEQYEAAQQQAQIDAAARNAAASYAVTATPEPTVAGNSEPGSGIIAELERLAQLKQQGLLSDAEFAAAKTKLLG